MPAVVQVLLQACALCVIENAVLLDEELTVADHLNSLHSLLSIVDAGSACNERSNYIGCLCRHREGVNTLYCFQGNLIMDCRFRRSGAVSFLRSIYRTRRGGAFRSVASHTK